MSSNHDVPFGTPGQPWGMAEISAWRASRVRRRSYASEVASAIDGLRDRFDVVQYGELDYPPDGRFPLYAVRSCGWDEALPLVLVTGGVHGYETSGVHGALRFLDRHADAYAGRANLLVAPCVSPWAYERIQRWNPFAIDPNRAFREDSPAPESAALMRLIAPWRDRFAMHIDLHETTDSDEGEFRPALAARTLVVACANGVPPTMAWADAGNGIQSVGSDTVARALSRVCASARRASAGALIDRWSHPSRIFSVTGTSTAATAASIRRSAWSRSRINAEPLSTPVT